VLPAETAHAALWLPKLLAELDQGTPLDG